MHQVSVTLPRNYEESLGLRRHNPPSESYPDTALRVNDSTISPAKKGRVVGVAYFNLFYHDRNSLVSKILWDEQKSEAFLVTANARSTVVNLRVFRLDLSPQITRHTARFPADDYRKWPPQLPLLGEFEVDLATKGNCGVKDLRVTPESTGLRIETEWDDKRCTSQTFHYYLSNQWSGDPIAETAYQSNTQVGKLILFKVKVETPKGFDFTEYYKQYAKPFPNYAYFLARYSGVSPSPRVLWLDYEAATSMFPRDHLTGSVIWDAQRKAAFVVTVKPNSGGSLLKVYRVSLDSNAAGFPFLLDNDPGKRPEGAVPLVKPR